jgi:hypothetical protein
MIDFLFMIGQVAAAMLVLYGAMLSIGTVMPRQHKQANLTAALEDEMQVLRHLQHDA